MKIVEISVGTGRTIPHPLMSYSNLKPTLHLRAELAEGEDPDAAYRALAAKGEQLIEDHCRALVQSIVEAVELQHTRETVVNLEKQMRDLTERMADLRGRDAELSRMSLPIPINPVIVPETEGRRPSW